MIVTLAVRLGDHLKAKLRSSVGPISTGSQAVMSPTGMTRVSQLRRPLVLVTGATGKTGSKLTAALNSRGYDVRALTSRSVPSSTTSIDWRVHDFRDPNADLRGVVSGCQAVLHLGAEVRHAGDMLRVNAEATGDLARAAEAEGVRFMAYTSSVSVYGSASATTCHEDSPVLSVDADVASEYWAHAGVRAYGRTKLLGEFALRNASKMVEYVIFRPTVIVDHADIQDIMGWTASRRALFAHHRTHHIYILDVVEALIWALERSLSREAPQPGVAVYNLSDDQSDGTFACLFHEARNRDARTSRWSLPDCPARIIWIMKGIRFRRRPFARRPFGLMSFPAAKLAQEGFHLKYGMQAMHKWALGGSEMWERSAAHEPGELVKDVRHLGRRQAPT